MKAWRAERREKALRLSIAGWSYQRIVDEAGLGYRNKQAVHVDMVAAYKEYRERQDLAAADKIARHEMLLNEAIETVHDIMNRRHLATGNGRVVQRKTGKIDPATGLEAYEDVYDDSVNLAAADKLRQLSESLRKLGGLDAPAKVQAQVDGTVSYSINVTPDEMDKL